METALLTEILELNFLPVVSVLFMGFFLTVNSKYEPVLTSFFKQMFYMMVCLILVTNLDYRMTDNGNTQPVHMFIAVIGCNLRVLIFLRLISIMDYNVTGHIKKQLSLPMIFNFLVLFLSFSTKLVVWYDGDGVLHTGPLGYVPHLVILFYGCYALYLAYRAHEKTENTEAMIIIIEVVISLTGAGIECVYRTRGILAGAIALNMVFYYLHMHICRFYKDPLTGALNRASFYADLKQYEGSIVAVYSIDLNGLKQVNDTNGHEAGDKLLKQAALSLTKQLLPQCYLYRTSGDEFVILCISLSKKQVQRLTANLFDCQAAGCDFAFGMHEFVTDPQTTFKLADDAMYRNKRNMKAAKK